MYIKINGLLLAPHNETTYLKVREGHVSATRFQWNLLKKRDRQTIRGLANVKGQRRTHRHVSNRNISSLTPLAVRGLEGPRLNCLLPTYSFCYIYLLCLI